MILLDTSVLSEILRPQPEDAVRRWMKAQPRSSLFTAAICEAEILSGVASIEQGTRRASLQRAVMAIFEQEFTDRILPFDSAAARAFADIATKRLAVGRPIAALDAQIAAIARSRGATLATRTVDDYADCGIAVISPWNE
jgi:toxin FitB